MKKQDKQIITKTYTCRQLLFFARKKTQSKNQIYSQISSDQSDALLHSNIRINTNGMSSYLNVMQNNDT